MTPDSQLADYPFITDFNPFDFFHGQLYAYGAFIDRTGAVKRRFTADITGHIEQDILILDEHFIFDDGEREQRIWKLKHQDNDRIAAFCDDVVGEASGRIIGSSLHLSYDFLLNISGRRIKFKFDDIIICEDGIHAVNRARVSKFGIFVGDVIITFKKLPSQ